MQLMHIKKDAKIMYFKKNKLNMSLKKLEKLWKIK